MISVIFPLLLVFEFKIVVTAMFYHIFSSITSTSIYYIYIYIYIHIYGYTYKWIFNNYSTRARWIWNELVMIISYPASPSRIIVLLKTPTSQLFYVEFIWPLFVGGAKLCICCCVHWPYLVVQVYELIACVRRANENAGNVISVVKTELRISHFQHFHIYIFIEAIQCKLCTWRTLVWQAEI